MTILDFLQGWQTTSQIEGNAAKECRIIALLGRWNSQASKLGKDSAVYRVSFFGPLLDLGSERNARAKHRYIPLVSGHDGNFTGEISKAHEACRGDIRHVQIVRFILNRSRDIFFSSVGISGDDGELLLCRAVQQASGWYHFDRNDASLFLIAIGHRLRDPLAKQSIFVRIDFYALTATVRNSANGFLE